MGRIISARARACPAVERPNASARSWCAATVAGAARMTRVVQTASASTLCCRCSRPAARSTADGMLTVAGCRADALAAEFGTPVLVVSEPALRARAREYADGLAARWPRSRVVFASKAFPCTAVQRVMVEEGLGLDVAGGGEIVTALEGRRRPGADRAARQREERRRDRDGRRARHRASSWSTTATTSTGSRRRCRPARAGRARARHPGRHRRHARARADRARGLEVRARPGGRRRADPRGSSAARGCACSGLHVARRLADPRRRAVRASRWRRSPRSASSRSTTSAAASARATRYADQPPSVGDYLDALIGAAREHLPAEAELIIEPGRSMVASAATTLYRVVTVKRGDDHVRRRRRRHGRQPRGRAVRPALRGRRSPTGSTRAAARRSRSSAATARAATCWSTASALDAPRVGDLLAVPATGRLLLHDGQQLQRQPPHPGRVRGATARRGSVVRRETWDGPARARRRVATGESGDASRPRGAGRRCDEQVLRRKPVTDDDGRDAAPTASGGRAARAASGCSS